MNTKDHTTTLEKVRLLSFRHNGHCYQKKTKKTPGEPTLAELIGWKSNNAVKRLFKKRQITF
jgi:hypothetical protein